MLGGGLLPGTLCVVYGATGIGKTHLGLHFAHAGESADGAPGIVFDLNARGDSQQHAAYASRRVFLFRSTQHMTARTRLGDWLGAALMLVGIAGWGMLLMLLGA